MRILKENALAVLVDIQERLFPHIYDNGILLANSAKLLEGLKILEVPVLVTQQYSKGLGQTVSTLQEKIVPFNYIEKLSFSCCDENQFIGALNRFQKKFIILFGIEAHVCLLQTCVDLLAMGYIPVLVEDCISSRKISDKIIAVERMRQEGAIISSYESILMELTRYAGNESFRKISGIIK
jgi:nicotinamidase-related amidase